MDFIKIANLLKLENTIKDVKKASIFVDFLIYIFISNKSLFL